MTTSETTPSERTGLSLTENQKIALFVIAGLLLASWRSSKDVDANIAVDTAKKMWKRI